jgi:predicted permease
MSVGSRLRSWIAATVRRTSLEEAHDDEWQSHIELRAFDLERTGLARQQALRVARAEFGSLAARHDESRDAIGLRLLDDLRADLLYAFRVLRQSPTFTTVAVLSLALGIGANSAMFSLMESVLWKTLPVASPEQLRQLSWVSGPELVMGSTWGNLSPTDNGGKTSGSFSYEALKALQRNDISAGLAVAGFKSIGRLTAVIDGHAELVDGELVSGRYYEVMGVRPVAGRAILREDDVGNAESTVALISDSFWATRFGRDRSVIGRTIQVNQVPVLIVGVNPAAFTGLSPGRKPDVFLPLSMQPVVLPWRYGKSPSLLDDPDYWWVLAMGRLAPGADARQAQAALDVVLGDTVRPLLSAAPGKARPRLRLTDGSRGVDDLRDEFSKPLLVLVAFVGLVLLIACANLANLLLARAAARQREISLRLALGAGHWRIGRQMLTEGLVIASLGGAAGVLLGFWLRDGIPRLLSTSWDPGPLQSDFNARVLGLSIVVTMLTGVMFSLAPMWQATRVRVATALKDGGRATMSRSRRLMRRSLVVVQVGLSVLLLIGAGLFIRTLWNLRSAELGFNPQRIVLFTIDPPRTRYTGPQRTALFARLEEAIASVPGVQSATLSSEPLVANSSSTTRAVPTGRAMRPGTADRTWVNEVGWSFFETMGIPVVYGRGFRPQDRDGSLVVAVVNQEFVRTFFPERNPLGQTFKSGDTVYQIVGVSGDARYNRISLPMPPTFYRAFAQAKDVGAMTFEVRTGVGPGSLLAMVREKVGRIDKDLPVFDVRTQEEQIDATLSQQRLFATLTSAFGLLALVLASVGIYGIISGSVASRIGEIGVRMALGAGRAQVLRMILREAVGLAAVGIGIGVAVSAWGSTSRASCTS